MNFYCRSKRTFSKTTPNLQLPDYKEVKLDRDGVLFRT